MHRVRRSPGHFIIREKLRSVHPARLSLRQALLCTVAAGTLSGLLNAVAVAGPDACAVSGSGTIATCSGNQSDGVLYNNGGGPITGVNVNNLTSDITPASGVTGVEFTSNGAVAVNIDTGARGIVATDAGGVFAASNSGEVVVTFAGRVSTVGGSATGIQVSAQDDTATVISSGTIATTGNNAFGIAGGTVYGNISVTSSSNITTAGTFAAGINIGTIGRLGTDDGAITVNSSGNITTTGISAIGINASTVYGPITVTSTGNVTVSGAASVGINAQTQGAVTIFSTGNVTSTGGGGPAILGLSQGDSISVTSLGNLTTQGDVSPGIYANGSDSVTITAAGTISTAGLGSSGIFASAGSGPVTVNSSGNISSSGADSHGIDATSFSSGSVTVAINGGSVSGGTGSAAGVRIDGDGANTLTNRGTVMALSGLAIQSLGGDDSVANFGTINGDVTLGSGANVFNNHAGGVFNSGATINLGSGNTLNNAGTLSPGGSGTIRTTALTGNLVQSSTGILAVDFNMAGATADRVNVTGTANLAGTVRVQLTNPLQATTVQQTILSATGGTTNAGLALAFSPAIQAQLLYPNANDVDLSVSVDLAPSGLSPSQASVADSLNTAFLSGSGALLPVTNALLNGVTTMDEYRAALDQLSPRMYLNNQTSTLFSSLDFADTLMSCRQRDGSYAIIREDQCMWAEFGGRVLNRDSSSRGAGFTEDAVRVSAGAQFAVAQDWRLNIGAGYESTQTETSSGMASSKGESGHAGVAIKYAPGPWSVSGAFSGGRGWYDTTRQISFGGFAATADGDSETSYLSGRLRAAYLLPMTDFYLKPQVDFDATHVWLDSFTETGGGGAALRVDGNSQTVLSASPGLEIGSERRFEQTIVRPYVRLGASLFDGTAFTTSASFADAPAGTPAFQTSSEIDRVMADVSVGVDILGEDGIRLRLNYDGSFGETTSLHNFGVKLAVDF